MSNLSLLSRIRQCLRIEMLDVALIDNFPAYRLSTRPTVPA